MRSTGLFLAALLYCGCAAETPAPRWHADARFTEPEREQIRGGMTWLEGASGHDMGGVIFDGDESATHRIRKGPGPGGESGLCQGSTIFLDVEPRPGGGWRIEHVAGLAAHELAHCELGFHDGYHAGDAPTDGIMRVLYPMQWTAAEEAQCSKLGCRGEGR